MHLTYLLVFRSAINHSVTYLCFMLLMSKSGFYELKRNNSISDTSHTCTLLSCFQCIIITSVYDKYLFVVIPNLTAVAILLSKLIFLLSVAHNI